MLMNAHHPAENITIAKVHLERPLSIEVALAHAWILPLIDLPLLGMRFFSYCTCIRCLLSNYLVFSYKLQIFHSKMKGKLKLLSWIFSWIWFLRPLCSETLVFRSPVSDFPELHRLQTDWKRVVWAKFRSWRPWFRRFKGFRTPLPKKKMIAFACWHFSTKNWTQPEPTVPPNRHQNDPIHIVSSYSKNNRMTLNRWKQGAGGEMP